MGIENPVKRIAKFKLVEIEGKMNAKEMIDLIGKKATYTFKIGKSMVEVKMTITDARHVFDRDEVLLVPVSGSGSGWANINNIEIEVK